MAASKDVECSFLVPLHRDAEISDGQRHPTPVWQWLNDEIYAKFEGLTVVPGLHKGMWKSPKTGKPIHDRTRKFVVALPMERVDDLRSMLRSVCVVFEQQCIYLSIAGYVEYIQREPDAIS